MIINSFEKLFLGLLSDIYHVETQIVDALPEMSRRAQSKELKEALQHHLRETKQQVHRLERIFNLLGEQPLNIEWVSNIRGLFEKGKTFMDHHDSSPLLDAAIIVMCQRVEHFEIATYGTLQEFADVLDYQEIKDLLHETLKEESAANEKLNKIAMGGIFRAGINDKAIAR